MYHSQPPFKNDRNGQRSGTAHKDWRVFSTKTTLLILYLFIYTIQAPTVLSLPKMSQNTVTTTNTIQDEDDDDTVPLLSRDHTRGTKQSTLSRLRCKITHQPDDITVERELIDWSRREAPYLRERIVSYQRDTPSKYASRLSHVLISRTMLSANISRALTNDWRPIYITSLDGHS